MQIHYYNKKHYQFEYKKGLNADNDDDDDVMEMIIIVASIISSYVR